MEKNTNEMTRSVTSARRKGLVFFCREASKKNPLPQNEATDGSSYEYG